MPSVDILISFPTTDDVDININYKGESTALQPLPELYSLLSFKKSFILNQSQLNELKTPLIFLL